MKTKNNGKKNVKDRSLLSYYGFTKAEQKKYPVVSGILKELTPERIELEIKKIQEVKLPPELQKWVDEYEKVGGERVDFLWKWLYEMFPIVKLPMDIGKYEQDLLETKILLTMLIVQLDDVADRKKNNAHNNSFFYYKKYFAFENKINNFILNRIKKYPNYKKLKEIYYFDLDQIFNTMRYSKIVNENNYLINSEEYWLYLSNNMAFNVYFMLDLMCCKKFNYKNLGMIRRIAFDSQKIGRISNWITTWKRELRDKDFTSGVFSYAIDNNVISVEELNKRSKNEIIDKINKANVVNDLLKEWSNSYETINKESKVVSNFNNKKFLQALKHLLLIDLACQGFK